MSTQIYTYIYEIVYICVYMRICIYINPNSFQVHNQDLGVPYKGEGGVLRYYSVCC